MRPPPLDPSSALFLDVDGTLLEIAARPDLVRVPQGLPALLDRLATERDGALALVSGRKLADLDRLLRPWRGAAAGLHGLDIRRPDGTLLQRGPACDAEARSALDRARPRLQAWAADAPGVLLEDKGWSLAMHYRNAPEHADEIARLADCLVHQSGEALCLLPGKMVVELLPHGAGKGGAIAALMAAPPYRGRRPIFLGDDVTDEHGFAEVNRRGGLAVRVGEAVGQTQAGYRLPSIAAALDWLAGGAK